MCESRMSKYVCNVFVLQDFHLSLFQTPVCSILSEIAKIKSSPKQVGANYKNLPSIYYSIPGYD